MQNSPVAADRPGRHAAPLIAWGPYMWHFYSTFYHDRWIFWTRIVHRCHSAIVWMWGHREATINLSDLISFLLVTPEVAHRLSSNGRVQAVLHYSGMLAALPLLVGGAFFGFDNARDGLYFTLFGVVCCGFAFIYLVIWYCAAFRGPFTPEREAVRRTDRTMLSLGVALFFCSRVAAIVGALVSEG